VDYPFLTTTCQPLKPGFVKSSKDLLKFVHSDISTDRSKSTCFVN